MKFDDVFEAALKKYNFLKENNDWNWSDAELKKIKEMGLSPEDVERTDMGIREKGFQPLGFLKKIADYPIGTSTEYKYDDQDNPTVVNEPLTVGGVLRDLPGNIKSVASDIYKSFTPSEEETSEIETSEQSQKNEQTPPTETITEPESSTPPASTSSQPQPQTPDASSNQPKVYGTGLNASIPNAVQVGTPSYPNTSYTAGYLPNQGAQTTSTFTSKPLPAQPATSNQNSKPKVMSWTATKS